MKVVKKQSISNKCTAKIIENKNVQTEKSAMHPLVPTKESYQMKTMMMTIKRRVLTEAECLPMTITTLMVSDNKTMAEQRISEDVVNSSLQMKTMNME